MSFSDLRSFLAVAEHGSFLAASLATGESRTTLRRQVDALEARTGVPLLRRDRRGVAPTDAGLRLLETGRVMERDFASLLDAIRETGRAPAGVARVLLPVGLHVGALSAILGLARATWPNLRFRLSFCDDTLQQKLPEADVIAWFGDRPPTGAWESRELMRVRQRLLASPEYLRHHGAPDSVEALLGHQLLVWTPPDDPLGHLVTPSGKRVPVQPFLASANIDLLHAAARMGTGIAWVPDAPVPPPPGEIALVPLLEGTFRREVSLHVAVPRSQAASPKNRVFLDHLDSIRQAALSMPMSQGAPGGPGGSGGPTGSSPQSARSKRGGAG